MKINKGNRVPYKLHFINGRQAHYPDVLKDALVNDAPVEWDVYLKHKGICSSRKVKVKVICQDCGTERITNFKHLNKRKVFSDEQYCSKCAVEAIKRTPEFAKINSEAQSKIQGLPEQRKKNAAAVRKFWTENPEVKKRMGAKISAFNQSEKGRETMRNRPSYNGRGVSGIMSTRFGDIQFDSCYELAFLDQMNNNPFVIGITRGEEIEYVHDGRKRTYFMDFTVSFADGACGWYEIKSKFIATKRHHVAELKAKLKAAFLEAKKKGAQVVLVHEGNALELIGRTFPRGHQRKQLIQELGVLVKLHNPKHVEKYQYGEIDL